MRCHLSLATAVDISQQERTAVIPYVIAAAIRTLVSHRFLDLEFLETKSCLVPAATDAARACFCVAIYLVMTIPLTSVAAKGDGSVGA